MNHIQILLAAAALSLAALPAAAQTRSLFDQPEAQDTPAGRPRPARSEARPQAPAAQKQDDFIERIQRSDRRTAASICADGCRGEIKGRTQPRDPFASLPDFDSGNLPTGYSTEP